MNAHVTLPDNVVRLSVRLRPVPASPALDAMLSAETIDARQHAAGLAYAALRFRFEKAARSARRGEAGLSLPEAVWLALKRDHAALLAAAGPERFMLDRTCLDDDLPLRCEVERVREALRRVAELLRSDAWSAKSMSRDIKPETTIL